MTKRHVTFVQSLYRGILSDISDQVPELRKECERDFSRLCSALENHGLRFLTIDLVDFGKHFDQCLSKSRLTSFKGTQMRPYKRGSVIPRLFRGLLLRVFQDSGCLSPTCDRTSIRFLRQLFFCAKKLELECENVRTFKAVREFIQVDAQVFTPTLDWDADHFDTNRRGSLRLDDAYLSRRKVSRDQLSFNLGEEHPELPRHLISCIEFAADVMASTLGFFEPKVWRGKHGPGAVSDLREGSKFEFPTWPKKLENVFPLADYAFANVGQWADALLDSECTNRFADEREPVSKLIAVPKTQKSPRLIASEPTAHQWCQQIVKAFLYENISSTYLRNAIHFRDQTFNKRAAKQASINQASWTIDLSSASDRVSCYVVERFFRRNESLLKAFHACRTRIIKNTIDPELPRFLKLRKFSTMGSALTFPVQSLIFACIGFGCLLFQRKLPCSMLALEALAQTGQVLVFGDDIVVPDDVGYLMMGALRYLGFEVNRSKTFGVGKFRESCGGEYFDGFDVTPTYSLTVPSRRRPESLVSCVAVHNNFFLGGYYHAAEYIKKTVDQVAKLSLPDRLPGSDGLYWAAHCEDWTRLRKKRDPALQCLIALQHVLVARTRVMSDRASSRLLQYFSEAPPPTIKWESGVRERSSLNLKRRWVPVRS